MVRSTLLTAVAIPLPARGTVTFGLAGSLLVMVREAEAMPGLDGPKRTVMSAVLPGTMVMGASRSTRVKAAPLLEIERTTRSAAPVLPIVSFASLVWPVATPPKSRDAGETEIDGAGPPAPVPLTATVTVDRAGS